MDKKEVFKKFLEENEILVVDKNPGSRNRLLKIVCDLGAKRHMVHTASGLVEATNVLQEKKISLVLSDYMVAGGSGFDLFKMLREQQPNNKKLCLVLVTSNISQTAVAKAAEEDVDSFIIKPYTLQSIQENLISTVVAKIQPTEYLLKIEEGKKFIQAGDLDNATNVLKEAMALNTKPALALFYIGQIEYMRKYTEEAKGSYQEGLSFNTIHFKCLVGLYELFLREMKFVEAYQVVKKISKYFPANPDRLSQIIRLAIQTKNYKDMQFYYEIFISLEERSSLLMNYMGAGLFVSGKFLLANNDSPTALQYFDNIAVSCSDFTKFTRATITILVEHKRFDEAQKYMARFPSGSKEDEDYIVSDYLLGSHSNVEPHVLVKKGLDLYNQKIRDVHCMKILLKAMEQSGYKEEKLAKYREEFAELWPQRTA
ncbi:MAG: response regulator [Bdellovibrionales bacterium]|nr:response regulator [Bdellovibrionales bacterium]